MRTLTTAGVSLRAAVEARPGLRQQLGETCYRQLLAIADDPTPEAIRQQNSIFLATWIPRALSAIARDEPSLAPVVRRIDLVIHAHLSDIGHVEQPRMERPCDTWEEQRGER